MTINVSLCRDGGKDRLPGMVLLVLMALAFMQPLRIWPFNTLMEEFALGVGVVLLAGLVMVIRGRYWLSPLLAVWAALGGLLLISALFVPRIYDSPLYAYGAFWLVGLGLTQLGPESSWRMEGRDFAVRMAWFLVIVGVGSVVLACIKYYQLWGELGRYLPAVSNGRMNGVIGQSNLFSVLCLLGVISTLWLTASKQMALWLGIVLSLLLGYALALAGSRVVGLIFVAVLLVALMQAGRLRQWRFVFAMAAFGFAFLLLQPQVFSVDKWVRDWLQALGVLQTQFVPEDVFERGVGSLRWDEWSLAWQIFLEHLPWGIGPGGYAAQSYAMHLRENVLPLDGIWLHSHNSYLQLWIDFGWAGVLWSIAMGWVVCRILWRAICLDQPIQATILLALLIHSFFEFPLWYVHFFVLAFWVLAAGESAREVPGKRLLGALVMGMACLALLFYGSLFSALIGWHSSRITGESVDSEGLRFVDRVVQDPLLKPYGLEFYYFYFVPGNLPLEFELPELEGLRTYLPFPYFSVRYSILLAAAGRHDEALKIRDELMRASPSQQSAFVETVSEVAASRPEWQLRPLLDGLKSSSVDQAQ